jgi:hypothetical protein
MSSELWMSCTGEDEAISLPFAGCSRNVDDSQRPHRYIAEKTLGLGGQTKVEWNYKNLACSTEYMNVVDGKLLPFTLLSKMPNSNGPKMQPPQQDHIEKLVGSKANIYANFKINEYCEEFFSEEDIKYWHDFFELVVINMTPQQSEPNGML